MLEAHEQHFATLCSRQLLKIDLIPVKTITINQSINKDYKENAKKNKHIEIETVNT